MTRVGDALHAVREGATAIGFVFWKGSPRYIEPERAGEIAAALPATVMTVGVFVNEPVDAIRETARVAGLRMVQLHGEETPAYMEQIDQPVMRAVTLDTMVETTKTWPADTTLLLDSTDPSRRGGGRAAVDWPRAAVITRGRRVVLAGGLTPDNIEEAIVTVRPIGVDVASGVESAPGVKDLDKVARFLANAQAAFARMVNP
jgi:phosphoribosylanthranilate isomerase